MTPEVLVALISAIATVLAALVTAVWRDGVKSRRALRALHADVAETKYEVKNHHTSNLRDDLDTLVAKVDLVIEGQRRHDALLAQHTEALQSLRSEDRLERQDRLLLEAHVQHIAEEVAHHHAAA